MRTPGGWAMAHMLYDKVNVLPPPGSVLDTVFLLVRLERSKASLLEQRAVIQGLIANNPNNTNNATIKAFEAYAEAMLPFLERAKSNDLDDAKKQLAEFVKAPAKIDLKPVVAARHAEARRKASKTFRVIPTHPGQPKLPGTKVQ